MKKLSFKSIMLILYLLAIVLMTVLLWPFFASIASEEGIASLQTRVDGLGIGGIFLVLGLQVLQIVVAIIPGEVLEFVSGALYGPWGGLILDLAGIFLGQTLIYVLVSRLGSEFAEKLSGSKLVKKFGFLKDAKKIYLLVFFLYFIPGTPKDAICYAAPLFNIKYKPFMVLSLFARIPSVITSTFAGSAFGKGDFMQTLLIYTIVAAASLAGLLLYNRVMKGREKNGADS